MCPKGDISFLEYVDKYLLLGTTTGEVFVIDPKDEKVLLKDKLENKIRFLSYFKIDDDEYLIEAEESVMFVKKFGENMVEVDKIEFETNLLEICNTLKFQDQVYLLVACCDDLIHVFQLNPEVEFLNSLPGHKNKIKAISVKDIGNKNEAVFISGALDNYIRLWKIHRPEKI